MLIDGYHFVVLSGLLGLSFVLINVYWLLLRCMEFNAVLSICHQGLLNFINAYLCLLMVNDAYGCVLKVIDV